jgi:hypothetical protein
MSPVHANAAAIDIGATVHVAAVGLDRDPEPVRSFGTFTPTTQPRRKRWSCCIDDVAVSTFTKRRRWPACASYPTAR